MKCNNYEEENMCLFFKTINLFCLEAMAFLNWKDSTDDGEEEVKKVKGKGKG